MKHWEGRPLAIATMHHKEKVIAPLLREGLGVQPCVPPTLNTDQFGTFTREIARRQTPLATARLKCQEAMRLANTDLAVASEGSFGQHPVLFFSPADEEIVLLIDRKNQLEIVGHALSTTTNFAAQEVKTEKELFAFADKIGFPEHALVLRPSEKDLRPIFKGITSHELLLQAFHELKGPFGSAFAETDMRAMYNPTRMQVIREATQDLVRKAIRECPACGTPGYSIRESESGLPCAQCGQATQSVKAYIYQCAKCSHQQTIPVQDKSKEDPVYCDFCNP